MNTRYRTQHPPANLVVLPPLTSAVIFGVGGALIGLSFWPDRVYAAGGAGLILGLMFGSGLWSGMLTGPWSRAYATETQPVQLSTAPQVVRIEAVQDTGVDWSDFILPDGVTWEKFSWVGRIVVENGYSWRNALFYPEKLGLPLSRSTHDLLRNMLIRKKVLAWNNLNSPNSGVRVCMPFGVRVFRRLAEMGNMDMHDETLTPRAVFRLLKAAERH